MRPLICLCLLLTVVSPVEAQKKGRSEGDRLLEAAFKAADARAKLELYAKALASGTLSKPDAATAHNNRAAILSDMGRKHEAIMEVSKAIALVPHTRYYYGNRARIRLSMNLYLDAAADFTDVIKRSVKPASSDFFDRCQAYAKGGNREAAIADCERALELKPGHRRTKALLDTLRR